MGDRVAMDFAFKAGNRFLREKDIRADMKAALRSSSKNGIEGTIYLTCDGVELIGEQECDLVDHLFAYVTDGLDAMLRGEEFTTFFPDQPLRLSITTKRDSVVVLVGIKSAVVPRDEFLRELHQLCLRFYEVMLFLFPSGADEPCLKALKLMPLRYPLLCRPSPTDGHRGHHTLSHPRKPVVRCGITRPKTSSSRRSNERRRTHCL